MAQDEAVASFERFVLRHELGLKRALVAAVGLEAGLDAAAEALAYGWEHWDRLEEMENPAGYLYRVGRSHARPRGARVVQLPKADDPGLPWVEPALPDALARLPEMQRSTVLLVHTFGYSLSETAALLGVANVDGSAIDNNDDFAFMRAFWDWLRPTYPDVHDEIRPNDGQSFPGWGRGRDLVEDMAVALQYMDEFLAQSDVYPLEPGNG